MSTSFGKNPNEIIVVEVFDGDKSLGLTATNPGKAWSMNLVNLATGEHALTGRIVSEDVVSAHWFFSVGISSDTEDFENARIGEVPFRGTVTMNAMTLTAETRGISISQVSKVYSPELTGRACSILHQSSVSITFNRPVKSFTFGIADPDRIPAQVIALDVSGGLILSQFTPSYGSANKLWATFTTPGLPIKTVRIIDKGGRTLIDNFTLNY